MKGALVSIAASLVNAVLMWLILTFWTPFPTSLQALGAGAVGIAALLVALKLQREEIRVLSVVSRVRFRKQGRLQVNDTKISDCQGTAIRVIDRIDMSDGEIVVNGVSIVRDDHSDA